MGDKPVSRKRGAPSSVDELQQQSKQQQPEAASSSSSSSKRRAEGSSSSKAYSLVPHIHPPEQPFVDKYFPVQLLLCDSKKAIKPGWDVHLSVEACYADSGELVPDQSVVELSPSTPARVDGAIGQASLDIRMRQPSMHHENRAFVLRFVVADRPEPWSSKGGPLTAQELLAIRSIAPVCTQPMTVIRHRLVITEHPPEQWYKDEGGRDKCMTITAKLVDADSNAVQGREVALRVTLCYAAPKPEDMTEVKNQSILKFPTDSGVNRVDSDGRVELKVRIEEVSKNHQKQAFVIKVAPDVGLSPANGDIAAAVSSPVTVLSKRNKRLSRRGQLGSDEQLTLSPSLSGRKDFPSPLSTLAHSAFDPLSADSSKPAAALRDSIAAIAAWCQHVARGLQSLEWQHVGFEVTPEGHLMAHRQLYRCPSCWRYKDAIRPAEHDPRCMLASVLQQWRKAIHAHLAQLMQLASSTAQPPRDSQLHGYSTRLKADGAARDAQEDDEQSPHSDMEAEDEDGKSGEDGDDRGKHDPQQHDTAPPQAVHHAAHAGESAPQSFSHSNMPPPLTATLSSGSVGLGHFTSAGVPSAPSLIPQPSFDFDLLQHNGSGELFVASPPQSPVPPPTDTAEQLVTSVHAVVTPHGVPAFSAAERLLGFYNEQLGDVRFFPIHRYGSVPPFVLAEVINNWKEAVKQRSDEVLWLTDFVYADRMAEEAIMRASDQRRNKQ